MTSRTTDIHCDKCGRYMHSLQPLERIPAVNICDGCAEKVMAGMADKLGPPSTPSIDVVDKLAALLDGGFIERYHIKGQRMLLRQSVADHSWRMQAIVFSVLGARYLTSSLLLAVAFHDVSERVTGDVPANVKRHNPDIQRAVHEVSDAEENRLGIRFDLTPEEVRLLAWADRFEGALHCMDEYEMGNRKIVGTLMRYWEYCSKPEYKLADTESEKNRRMLMTELNQRIERIAQ